MDLGQPTTEMKPYHPACQESPWTEIDQDEGAGGMVSTIHSSKLASLPVRDITRLDQNFKLNALADNKSDPNIETMTFGVFSTCEMRPRKKFVEDGRRYLFFRTKWQGQNSIIGYYDVKWHLSSQAPRYIQKGKRIDVVHEEMLAATHCHFVAKPVPLSQLADIVDQEEKALAGRAIQPLKLSAAEALELKALLDEQPDASEQYLEEIERLEEYQRANHNGIAYLNWPRKNGFSWVEARRPIEQAGIQDWEERKTQWNENGEELARNWWMCESCDTRMESHHTIKFCNTEACHAGGPIRPLRIGELPVEEPA